MPKIRVCRENMLASTQLRVFCVILTLLVGTLRLSSALGTAANDDEQKLGSKRNFIRKVNSVLFRQHCKFFNLQNGYVVLENFLR